MPKCIFCGEEVENSKEHIAEKHLGINQPAAAAPPQIPDPPKPLPIEEPKLEKVEKTNALRLPMEKPKKRYLDAAEIITLLQNTNKQFSLNQVQGCPLTKGD